MSAQYENGVDQQDSFKSAESFDKVELENEMVFCPSKVPKYLHLSQGDKKFKCDNYQQSVRLKVDGTPIELETNLFKGRLSFCVKDEQKQDNQVFKDKKRRSIQVIQGQFKGAYSFNDIETGQEFPKDLNMPKSQIVVYIFKLLLSLLQKTNPSYRVGTPEHNFYMFTPIIAAANYVNVSKPQDAPRVEQFLVQQEENMLIINDKNLQENGQPLKSEKRKHYFCKEENRAKHNFDPNLVYTFCFYQHVIDFRTFQVPLNMFGSSQQMLMGSFKNINLYDYANGQPVKQMCKNNKLLDYPWSFDMYPRKEH